MGSGLAESSVFLSHGIVGPVVCVSSSSSSFLVLMSMVGSLDVTGCGRESCDSMKQTLCDVCILCDSQW